jgi:putative transposase
MIARDWFTPAEIVAAKSPELPGTVRNLNRMAETQGWRTDPTKARPAGGKGGGWEYHLSALPSGAQARLALLHPEERLTVEPTQTDASKTLWARYETFSKSQKAEAQSRLEGLQLIDRYLETGRAARVAIELAAEDLGVSRATLYNWRKLVAGLDRTDWLPALAPASKATATHADCHRLAWEALTSDWLRPEKPSFSSCYRRVRKVASKKGWLPFPSERALRRRVEFEVSQGVILLAREGREKAKRLFPAQQRIRSHFHAMQAVNADAHKLDVFVRLDDGSVTRVHLVAMQDLYSGMMVAWRLADSENKETVRLVIGDMVERYGIPDACWLDNGRAFASKWITGRMANRYRFKIRDEDPAGVLTTLDVKVHWTTPYHGQAKPIERAFRDLADNISKHPFCAGAYTGNKPDAKPENYGSRAIPIAEFRAHVANQIAEHNERPGRKAQSCQGRSFLETFETSRAEPTSIVRWASPAQRSLWLLAADVLRAEKGSGEIRFHGNRYWSRELNEHAGQKVVVRFDPDKLHDSIKVYTLDDRLICDAQCIQATGFDDAEAARSYQRDRKAHQKAVSEQLRLTRKMSAEELGRLYGTGQAPQAPAPMPPKVKRLAVGGAAAAPVVMDEAQEDFEASFSRGLRLIGDADIITFTPKSTEHG